MIAVEAPRWRLTAPHYINVKHLPDGTKIQWEHKETSRETGRIVRKLYDVPVLLDPEDKADWNYPGEIIVAHEVPGATGHTQDYIITGDPSQNMEPLNFAAVTITDKLRPKWIDPIESLPVTLDAEENAFMKRMMEAVKTAVSAPPANTVPMDKYLELLERVTQLEEKATKPVDKKG